MSAEFTTEITIQANKEDLFKLIKALYDFGKHSKKANKKYSYLDFVEIKSGNLTNDDGDVTTIKEFVAKCNEIIFVSANGPYGHYYELKEVKLFEHLAEVAPSAYFKGSINGYSGTLDQWLEGELNCGLLYLSGSCIDGSDLNGDSEYGQYVQFIKQQLSYAKFCKLFRIDKEELYEDDYDTFIDETRDTSLCEIDYQTFIEFCDCAEINEYEFNDAIEKIKDLNLITFEEFMCKGYFNECKGVTTIIYDPIEKEYY